MLAKPKLHITEILISKSLINPYIIHDQCFSVNNVLREENEMKEEIKHSETSVECNIKMLLIWSEKHMTKMV